MKTYTLVAFLFIPFTFSFCTQRPATQQVSSKKVEQSVVVKKEKKGCCASNIPARFTVKQSQVPQPANNN